MTNSSKEGHSLPTEKTNEIWDLIFAVAKPEKILEIGYYEGHATRLMLDRGAAVHSIDIGKHEQTRECMEKMVVEDLKFTYEIADSKTCNPVNYEDCDLAFIDGDHSTFGVLNDIMLALKAGITWIVIDDYDGKWFANIIQTVDFLEKQGLLRRLEYLHYDALDGRNTLALMKNALI
jgi:predicted O-methyltransferase YrrM